MVACAIPLHSHRHVRHGATILRTQMLLQHRKRRAPINTKSTNMKRQIKESESLDPNGHAQHHTPAQHQHSLTPSPTIQINTGAVGVESPSCVAAASAQILNICAQSGWWPRSGCRLWRCFGRGRGQVDDPSRIWPRQFELLPASGRH